MEALREITKKVRNDEKLDRYSYGERALREEIIETIVYEKSEPSAIITRNGYGALVLNTANVMFVDIDFVSEGIIKRIVFAFRRFLNLTVMTQEERKLQLLKEWMHGYPNWGMRVYRTKAGLRCLVTHDLFGPSHPNTMKSFDGMGADPLYMRLCANQESFRARLTPKPWRCKLRTPPNKYPWDDVDEERRYRQWEENYNRVITRFTTCKLLDILGSRFMHPEVEAIQVVHDRYACVSDEYTLA